MEKKPCDQVGAVLRFNNTVELERVLAWIKKLEEAGHLESATVQTYDPAYGEPVFYIP